MFRLWLFRDEKETVASLVTNMTMPTEGEAVKLGSSALVNEFKNGHFVVLPANEKLEMALY